MTDTSTAELRRALIQTPERRASYDAFIMAYETIDPAAAILAARRSCVLDATNRRIRGNLLYLLRANGLWAELRAATPRRPRPLPPRRLHPVDIDAGVTLYDRLLDEMARRSGEGWTPSRVEVSKYRFPLDHTRLANFRRSEVSSGTQTVPDRPGDFPPLDFSRLYPDFTDAERSVLGSNLNRQFLGFLTRLYRRGAPGINWCEAAVADDDRFGARTVELPGVGTATAKSLQSAYYACRIASLVPRGGVVLEIGGGFGAVASRLLAIRPDVTYLLTDLPVNMVLTHTYLTSLYGEKVAGLWEDGDRAGDGKQAWMVPPWRLASLPVRVDLAINTMSFQHMDERNHAYYGAAMKALGTRRLYHLNRNVHRGDPASDTMVVPAERYGFMADYKVVESTDFDGDWIEVIADSSN